MLRNFHGFLKSPQLEDNRQAHITTTDEDTNWINSPLSDPPSLPDSRHFKREEQTKINSFYAAVKAFFLLDAHQLDLPQELITKLILCDERGLSDILESAGEGDFRTTDRYKRQYEQSLIKSSRTLHGYPRGLLNLEIEVEPDGLGTTYITSAVCPDRSFFRMFHGTVERNVELYDVRISSIEWDYFAAQDTIIANSTLQDVRFDDATFNGVTFQKEISKGTCNIWDNVVLTNVTFDKVRFEGVILKNVHLTDVHITDATFRNFSMENVSWNNIILNHVEFRDVQYEWSMWTRITLKGVHLHDWSTQRQNTARVTVENRTLSQEPANDLAEVQNTHWRGDIASPAVPSSETSTEPSIATSAAALESPFLTPPASPHVEPQPPRHLPSLEASTSSEGRAIANSDIDGSTAQHDTSLAERFPFLKLPPHIREKIYELIIPHVPLVIGDYDAESVPADQKRTHYHLKHIREYEDKGLETTYFVKPFGLDRCDFHLEILATCRSIHQEASLILWNNSLWFYCSPEGGLAFLHDHTLQLHNIRIVRLCYSLRKMKLTFSAPPAFQTEVDPISIGAWRRFLNVLVHYCPGIETCSLWIDKTIWARAPWNEGVDEVFRRPDGFRRSIDDNEDSHRRALELVARFHDPKTKFVLSIEETNTPLRRQRAKELGHFIIDKMKDRPFYDRKRICECPPSYLKSSRIHLHDCCITKWRADN